MAWLTAVQYYKVQRLFKAFHGGHEGLRKAAVEDMSRRAGIPPFAKSIDLDMGDCFPLLEFVGMFEKGELQVEHMWEKCLGADGRIDQLDRAVAEAEATLPQELSAQEIDLLLQGLGADTGQVVALKMKLAGVLLVDADLGRAQDKATLKRAREELEWVLRCHPACVLAHAWSGVALWRMNPRNNRWDACTSVRRALMLQPANISLWTSSASISRAAGDAEEAHLLLRAAKKLEAGGTSLEDLGWHPFQFMQDDVALDHLWEGDDGVVVDHCDEVCLS